MADICTSALVQSASFAQPFLIHDRRARAASFARSSFVGDAESATVGDTGGLLGKRKAIPRNAYDFSSVVGLSHDLSPAAPSWFQARHSSREAKIHDPFEVGKLAILPAPLQRAQNSAVVEAVWPHGRSALAVRWAQQAEENLTTLFADGCVIADDPPFVVGASSGSQGIPPTYDRALDGGSYGRGKLARATRQQAAYSTARRSSRASLSCQNWRRTGQTRWFSARWTHRRRAERWAATPPV